MSNEKEAEKAARECKIIISEDELRGLKAFNLGIGTCRPDLALLSDCLLMLDSYLANDGQMNDDLVQKALKVADIYKTAKRDYGEVD